MTEQQIIDAVQPVLDAASAPFDGPTVGPLVWLVLCPLQPRSPRAHWGISFPTGTTCQVLFHSSAGVFDVTVTKT